LILQVLNEHQVPSEYALVIPISVYQPNGTFVTDLMYLLLSLCSNTHTYKPYNSCLFGRIGIQIIVCTGKFIQMVGTVAHRGIETNVMFLGDSPTFLSPLPTHMPAKNASESFMLKPQA